MNKSITVAAVMTAPRYVNANCRNVIQIALQQLKIPLTVSGGVYYGQCMQMMLEQLAASECEYVITIDGDTMFKPSQLQRLLNIICQEEYIDAIVALQVRRGKPTMLGTCEGKKQFEWDGQPVRLTTAHFGLTVLRMDKLRQTPKPWFFCQPDEKGEWSDDRIDSDVWFWRQWEKAGNSLYLDPGCRIGHMEEMVAIYDAKLNPTHVYPNDWLKEEEMQVDEDSVIETLQAV